jgi:hypothetical protein
MTLLRTQATEKQGGQLTPTLTPAVSETQSAPTPAHVPNETNAVAEPDLVLDPDTGVIGLLQPKDLTSPILGDIAVHDVTPMEAEEQLAFFRRCFLPEFPFVHIPESTTAKTLRQAKPFLWLVIMALTSRFAVRQFAMQATIWKIISQRAVVDYITNIDLLQGIICFNAWFVSVAADMANISLNLDKVAALQTG